MARKETALLMTVGTGIGGEEATEDLAHGIFYSIDNYNPDKVVFVDDDHKNVSAARNLNISNLTVIKAWDK